VIAKKRKLQIGEFSFAPSPRREEPRIGGIVRANLRIFWALLKCLFVYFFVES
jgi:hypothetical protein